MSLQTGFFLNMDAYKRLCELQEQGLVSMLAFTVGSVLCRSMGKTDECWPKREAIGSRAGIPRVKTISKALGELASVGFIEIQKGQRGNIYRFCRGGKCPSRNPAGAESAPAVGAQSAPAAYTYYERSKRKKEPLLTSSLSLPIEKSRGKEEKAPNEQAQQNEQQRYLKLLRVV